MNSIIYYLESVSILLFAHFDKFTCVFVYLLDIIYCSILLIFEYLSLILILTPCTPYGILLLEDMMTFIINIWFIYYISCLTFRLQ